MANIQSNSRDSALWPVYCAIFAVLALLLALSPVLRALSLEIPYDRICELLVASLIVSTLLAQRFQVPREWAGSATLISVFLLVSALVNWQFSPLFHPTLVLLDSKILLCVIAMWLCGGVRLPDTARRRLSAIVYVGFVAAVAGFGLLNAGSGRRLQLLDESNYMILALIISSVVLIDAWRIKVLSPAWLAVFAVLVSASMLAHSRTGFATVALVGLGMLWAARKRAVVLVLGYLGLFVVMLDLDRVLEALTRGETDISDIDRFVFVRELWLQWSDRTVLEVLFGNTVGAYLSENTYGMHYWVRRQTAAHGIPFGLSPFNFHAFVLRLPLDIGLVPALAMMAALYVQLRRTTSIYVVVVLFVSCLSMSVFYLSTVMPFIVLAQLVRPLPQAVPSPGQSQPETTGGRAMPAPVA